MSVQRKKSRRLNKDEPLPLAAGTHHFSPSCQIQAVRRGRLRLQARVHLA
jgi:hypothetical protein